MTSSATFGPVRPHFFVVLPISCYFIAFEALKHPIAEGQGAFMVNRSGCPILDVIKTESKWTFHYSYHTVQAFHLSIADTVS